MSLSRREWLAAAVAASIGGTFGAGWARVALTGEPLFAKRARPLLLKTGPMRAGRVLIQRLRLPVTRLARVLVAIESRVEQHPCALTIRAGHQSYGPFPATADTWLHGGVRALRFDLPDLALDAGEVLAEFSLPGASAHLVPRGVLGRPNDFGRESLRGERHRRILVCSRERWSGLAIPAQLTGGAVRLEVIPLVERLGLPYGRQPLWPEALDADFASPIRTATLQPAPPVYEGHLVVRFDPLDDSFGKSYAVRLSLPPGAVVAGSVDGFGFVPLFGDPDPHPPFAGTAISEGIFEGCDLALAAWGQQAR